MRLGKAEIAGAGTASGVRSAVPRSWRQIQLASIAFVVGWAAIGAGCHAITSPEGEASPARDAERFMLGRPASVAEIAAWDLDVMPNGEGLPDGEGNVASGETLYIAQCQHCHGAKGKGKPFDQLAGRIAGDAFPFALDPLAPKTIGSYWPYATTLFDYVRRAMPLERPGSLSNEEVYSLTAYLLHLNELIEAETQLSRENLPKVVMPSRDRFVMDDRSGGGEIR